VRMWSYIILGALLGIGVIMPMAWCRFLCPLGTALWPVSKIGFLRLRRSENACTGCGACDEACPQSLTIATVPEVRSGECTLCLECTDACPSPGALELFTNGKKP